GAKQGLTGPAAQARTEAELQRREAEQKAQQQKLLESPHTPFETGSDAAIEDLQGRSLQLQSEAGDLEGQAARREAEAEAAAADDKQRELRNYNEQVALLQEERKQRIEAKIAERDQLAREIGNSKIVEREPSIANLIGVALSGFLNPGGRNIAVEILERRIDRDLKRQEKELSNKRALFGMKGNELNDLIRI